MSLSIIYLNIWIKGMFNILNSPLLKLLLTDDDFRVLLIALDTSDIEV